jgi:hypothetical protein
MAWVERLFQRFFAMYGSRFTSMWSSPDEGMRHQVKEVWAEGLLGYSGSEIRQGLAACKSKIWPPTLPEFLLLCRPAIDVERSWYEAKTGAQERQTGKNGQWSSLAVFWAYVEFGSFDLLHGVYETHKKRWQMILEKKVAEERAGQLAVVPELAPELPCPRAETAMPNSIKERLRALTSGQTPLDQDPLRWARRAGSDLAKRMIVACALKGDARFIALLREHVANGVISAAMAEPALR